MVKNKVVFITGGASGIGFEIGKEFARNGAKVALSDINAEKVQEVSESLSRDGYECIGLKCDVTNEKELIQALDRAVEKYGRLDVLINNAGLQHVASIEDFPTEKFEFMTKVMLIAPFIA